jgi:oligopeptide/dipeptide ABC transporter ATP-binding protein
MDAYPHQLSGGMRQRAMIAMALACRPSLLIADEATTALDTTVQAQILELLIELQSELGMAILFISHNLGVVSEIADEVMVMYAGRAVERAPAEDLFSAPSHPYTQGLLASLPDRAERGQPLAAIPGAVPDPLAPVAGCAFHARCAQAADECLAGPPALSALSPERMVACTRAEAGS